MPSHSCCGATWVQRKLDVGIKNGNLQHARIARDLGLPLTSAVCPPAIRGLCIACDAHGKSIKIEGLKVWIVPNDCIREKGTIIECQPTSLGEEWWHTHAICAWPHSDPANSLKVTRVTRNTKPGNLDWAAPTALLWPQHFATARREMAMKIHDLMASTSASSATSWAKISISGIFLLLDLKGKRHTSSKAGTMMFSVDFRIFCVFCGSIWVRFAKQCLKSKTEQLWPPFGVAQQFTRSG